MISFCSIHAMNASYIETKGDIVIYKPGELAHVC